MAKQTWCGAKSLVHHAAAAGFADGPQPMERPIFHTALAKLAHQQAHVFGKVPSLDFPRHNSGFQW